MEEQTKEAFEKGNARKDRIMRDCMTADRFLGRVVRKNATARAKTTILDRWKRMLDSLEAHGALPFVIIDLSIVRGLEAHTGFVYEAFEASGEGRALAGGGRYDHLLKKLSGNEDLPACGFAIGDMTLSDCRVKGLTPQHGLP